MECCNCQYLCFCCSSLRLLQVWPLKALKFIVRMYRGKIDYLSCWFKRFPENWRTERGSSPAFGRLNLFMIQLISTEEVSAGKVTWFIRLYTWLAQPIRCRYKSTWPFFCEKAKTPLWLVREYGLANSETHAKWGVELSSNYLGQQSEIAVDKTRWGFRRIIWAFYIMLWLNSVLV